MGECNRFSEGPARIATAVKPWACIRLAERLYGHGGRHGSAIVFLKGPRGSQWRSHHGYVSALLSAFRTPEERMGTQNHLLPEAREDRKLPEARVQFLTPERVHRLDPWTRREVYPRVSVLCPIEL